MKRLLTIASALLLTVAPIALPQGTSAEIDSGTFVLTLDGQEVLFEHFGLSQLPDGTFDMSSSILLVVGEEVANRLQRLRYDENFVPVKYFRHNFINTDDEQIIRATFSGISATSTVDTNGEVTEENFTTEREFSLLDRNASTHWYGLVKRRELAGADVHVSDTLQPSNQAVFQSRLYKVADVELFSGLDSIQAEELRYEAGPPDNPDENDILRLFVVDGIMIALAEVGSDEGEVIGFRKDLYP